MPLDPPRLDDRAYDDLVAELVARIPAHTPEWTNVRPGDPGRTLLELFAWLGDTILYRANLIPERQRLVFLRLLGMGVRPARPARGLIAVALDAEDSIEPVELASRASVSGPPEFETRGEVTVLPFATPVFVKQRLNAQQASEMASVLADLKRVYDIPGDVAPYVTTPLFANASLPEGFDLVRDSVDSTLWFALLAPKPELVAPARSRLNRGDLTINVGMVPAIAAIERFDEIPARRAVDQVWEVSLEGDRGEYRQLSVLADDTAGFTRDGVVRLLLAGGRIGAPSNDVGHFFEAGVGDLPPRLDDPKQAARLVTWLRFRPLERLTSLSIAWAGLNAVEIEQLTTREGLIVGQSNGQPGQVVKLPATSVDAESFRLQIEHPQDGFVLWEAVPDLAGSAPDARAFVLDSEAGTVRLGDGIRGLIPAPGMRLRVERMRSGGGAAGNTPAGFLKKISALAGDRTLPKLKVLQRLPTHGGADAESLASAEQRIPLELRTRDRFVTGEDGRILVASTPGIQVGRCEVLRGFKPQQRRSNVPGVVSVMVLPAVAGAFEAPNPRPDRPFIEAVHAWLDSRRVIGTELYVIGCEYVPVGVSAAVGIRDGFERNETLTLVKQSIQAYLWPLAPGGASGTGWPLGAAVSAQEIEVAIARVPGVSASGGVRLFTRAGNDWREATGSAGVGSGKIALEPWQLPELLSVVVVTGDQAPGDLRGAPNPFAAGGVPVPVVPEVC